MNDKAEGAKEYHSYKDYINDRSKHRRMHNDLQDKYKGPMTMNQTIGFKFNDPTEKEIMKMDTYPKNK